MDGGKTDHHGVVSPVGGIVADSSTTCNLHLAGNTIEFFGSFSFSLDFFFLSQSNLVSE